MNENQENKSLRDKVLLNYALNDIMNVASLLYEDCVQTTVAPTLLSEVLISLNDNLLNEFQSHHIQTGFEDLDRRLGSLAKGEMLICGAPPEMGGTTFMVQLALNMMKDDNHILFISPCMSKEALSIRFLGALTALPYHRISLGRINDEERKKIQDSMKELDNVPLYIDDSVSNLLNLKQKCVNQKLIGKFDVLMIDCLEMIEGSGNINTNKDIESRMICRTLKSLAKEFNVCVIVGAKMQRSLDEKNNFYPKINDLLSWRAFEQEANKILLLYSAERYRIFEDEQGNHLDDVLELVLVKNNGGFLGGAPLRFDGRSMKISSIDDYCVLDEGEEKEGELSHQDENPF